MTRAKITPSTPAEYAAELGTEGSVIDQALVADQRYYLPGDMLMKTDSMSMAHGVEVRVPFLDRRIMEFANGLDASLISPLRGPDKRILRKYLERQGLPVDITRGNKKGFNIPVAGYLRNGLRSLGDLPCPAPTLHIAQEVPQNKVITDWSTAYPGWRLQSANSRTVPPLSVDAPGVPSIVNARFTITNVPVGSNRFYRLIK